MSIKLRRRKILLPNLTYTPAFDMISEATWLRSTSLQEDHERDFWRSEVLLEVIFRYLAGGHVPDPAWSREYVGIVSRDIWRDDRCPCPNCKRRA